MALSRDRAGTAPRRGRGLLHERDDQRTEHLGALADGGRRRGDSAGDPAATDRKLRRGRALDGRRPLGGPRAHVGRSVCLGGRVRRKELPPRAEEAHQAALLPASEVPEHSMTQEEESKEAFLDRWSRRKLARTEEKASPQVEA